MKANFLVSLGCIHKASSSVLYGGTCAFSENETDKETVLHTVYSVQYLQHVQCSLYVWRPHQKEVTGAISGGQEKYEMEQNMDEG